jgi:hypothetical protein
MIFNVPIAYEVTGTLKGRRKPSTQSHWEYVEIDVPLADDTNAPVAVTWDDRPYFPIDSHSERDKWSQAQRVPEGGTQVMRVREDGYFIRHHSLLTPEAVAETLVPRREHALFDQPFVPYSVADSECPAAEAGYRTDQECTSTFDEVVAQVRAKAADHFFADGHLYRRSSEPVVKVMSLTTSDRVVLVPRVIPVGKLTDREFVYRVDRYCDAVAKCNEFNRLRGARETPLPEVGMERAPDILLHEAFNYDDRSANLAAAARAYIGGVSRHVRLAEVEVDFGIAFLQLRKHLELYEQGGDPDMLAACARDVLGQYGHSSTGALERAMEEYEARTVDINADVAPRR